MEFITDNHLPFRDNLMPASFRGAMFHVEAGGKESGRRIVVHEFPKKEFPYAKTWVAARDCLYRSRILHHLCSRYAGSALST